MQLLETSAYIDVPADVAKCPYCGAALRCRPEAWTQEDDGSWSASEANTECMAEPELADEDDAAYEKWDEWWANHSAMPFVYQLPVDLKVLDWINKNFRFNVR